MLTRIPSGTVVDFKMGDPRLANVLLKDVITPKTFVWVRGYGMFETRGCEGVVDEQNNYIIVAVLESL